MKHACREVSLLVSQSLDERLPPGKRLRVRLHLLVCAACRNFERQALFVKAVCRELAGRATGPRSVDGPTDSTSREK